MNTYEHEQNQFEALGHFTDDRAEMLARAWRRPSEPRNAKRHDDVRATSELGALALPFEHWSPRLA